MQQDARKLFLAYSFRQHIVIIKRNKAKAETLCPADALLEALPQRDFATVNGCHAFRLALINFTRNEIHF
ncbi:MAG: hypothetical protein QW094_07895 [Candidatus Caldarchaeum sp.]